MYTIFKGIVGHNGKNPYVLPCCKLDEMADTLMSV